MAKANLSGSWNRRSLKKTLFSSMDAVTAARIVIGAVLVASVLFPSLWQPVIDYTYGALHNATIYRLSTFETLWTVLCYAAIEPYITYIYVQQPEKRFAVQRLRGLQHKLLKGSDLSEGTEANLSTPPRRPRGMKRPSRRLSEAITYFVPLLTMDLTMIKKFANVSLEDMLLSGNYDPTFVSLVASTRNNRSATTYHHPTFLVPSLHNFTWSSPLQTRRALPLEAPSSRRLAFELITSFFIYDTLFFLFHLALHTVPPLKSWHAAHHAHGEMHPQITNKLSVAERLGLVLLANFSLNVIGSHVLTRTLFVPIFVWLLVEIHSGLDLDLAYDKILPEGWAGGARKHARHHAAGDDRALEPFFAWWDLLLDHLKSVRLPS